MRQNISKKDAAKRQLRQAILLFAEEQDTVSVHTLMGAALQILHDLAKARGAPVLLKENEFIIEGREKEWIKFLNAPQNFFKHADKDADVVFEFAPETTRLFLFATVALYAQEVGELFPEAAAYFTWCSFRYPNLLKEPLKNLVGAGFEGQDNIDMLRQLLSGKR